MIPPTTRRPSRRLARALLVTALLGAHALPAPARTFRVPALKGALAAAVDAAGDGDTLLLARGVHVGGAAIRRRLTLRGEPGAVVDGGGRGSILEIRAGGVCVADMSLRGSGQDVMAIDAGISVKGATGIRVARVRMEDVLYGVAAERADSLRLESCALRGRAAPSDGAQFGMDATEGNGVHLWYCRDAVVRGCRVTHFVDAIYLSFVLRARIAQNVLWENGRYGLHTMYNQENRLAGNRFMSNQAGCALMFSNHLEAVENYFEHNRGPRTYGLLLRDCSDGRFWNNRMVDNTVALFMDGSNRNRFHRNLIQNNGWGLILFSSCDGNEFAGNTFWNNDYPVALDMRRSDNRFDDGASGNYWSENAAYDLDGDGVSDVPFSPVSAFAFLSKQFPDLAIFGTSPAAATLGVAERTIPALRPSEIVDRFPLVAPSHLAPARRAPGAGRPARRAAGAAVGFALLSAAGVFGLARGGRPR